MLYARRITPYQVDHLIMWILPAGSKMEKGVLWFCGYIMLLAIREKNENDDDDCTK